MKVIDTVWFTQMTSSVQIGIVKGIDEITGKTKFYIGTGIGKDLHNEKMDIKLITNYGSPFRPEQLTKFFKPVETEKQLPGQEKIKFKKK